MLKNITIENYRLFEKFHLEGMTHINLLVGTNNSGKSSLLEAIYLLVNYKDPTALLRVLFNRGEFVIRKHDQQELGQISSVFRGHQFQKDHNVIISSEKDEQLSLEYAFINDNETSRPTPRVNLTVRERQQSIVSGFFELKDSIFSDAYSGPVVWRFNKHLITTERLNYKKITNLWDEIVLTPKEDMILDALRILEPNLERIALMSQTTPEMSVRLKIKGNEAPVPLGSMGDGMYRILALTMSLVSSENGVLLVDEIDTGLHYKTLTQMWRLVIETAKKLDAQVFATTHSWDCLAAFQQALTQTEENDLGTVFRLERKNGQIDYVAYTGDELAVAIDHDIEVR